MLGELNPTAGAVQRARGARVSLLNQHHAEQINLDQTPLDFLAAQYSAAQRAANPSGGGRGGASGAVSRETEEAMRAHLSSCGIAASLQLVRADVIIGHARASKYVG